MPRCALALLGVLLSAGAAHADPTGAHPRLILDDAVRAAWKQQAGDADSAVGHAIARCDQIRADPKEFQRDLYMGLDWSQFLHSCLIAWAATGKDAYAKTSMIYFEANLDDLEIVGDGKGGDAAARRDSGYAMRAMGPSTALAYDWLHDYADMTEALRTKARQRFAAWTAWYETEGYRARSAGSNYQAGWLIAATFIAIAEGGEAGKTGDALWRHVADDLWGQDMAKALTPDGVLAGGDWPEGWEYGPLAIASYALAAREVQRQGVVVDGVGAWLDSVMHHHVYALTPGGGMWSIGDTQDEAANAKPKYLAYAAVLIGGASAEAQGWAAAEIEANHLSFDDFPIFGAVAEAGGVAPVAVPRASWPTSYIADGTGTFYARTTWDDDAVWMAVSCTKTLDTDHFRADAGNVVLSRGKDDVIVDPTPYGSLSSLTGNAPTVRSGHLPDEYLPSQAFWSVNTGYAWARQTSGGVIAARCDYADQYTIQERPSDVPAAVRDVVLIPYDHGASGALVVIDRATSGDPARELDLRFRTQAKLTANGDVLTGNVGGTALAIRRVESSGGTLEVRHHAPSDCFADGITRGGCDAARLAIDEARLIVPGPEMSAIHVIDVSAGGAAPDAAPLDGADGVVLTRGDRVGVVAIGDGKDLAYTAPPGTHVVVGAPSHDGHAVVSATLTDGKCAVRVSASGDGTSVDALPVVVALDAACAIVEEQGLTVGKPRGGGASRGGHAPRTARTGCCGASASPGSPIAMAAIVLVALFTMRRGRAARR